MNGCPVTALAQELIALPSITPDDAGCQPLLIARLQALGFTVERLTFGEVCNFWAWHGSYRDSAPCLTFAGHTDVVPPGPLQHWQHPPFAARLDKGMLYGRGAADMKGALAAMVVAAERFVTACPQHLGRLAFLITADEEGRATHGTIKVVETLMQRGEQINYCLVGEPSSSERLGDVIKNGRRGSLTGQVLVEGIQGHVAYPQLASNPIHKALPALQALLATEWDRGTSLFPPTRLQLVDLQANGGGSNVIPQALKITCNWRYSPALTDVAIRQRVTELLAQHRLSYTVEWWLSGRPFVTPSGALLDAVVSAVQCCTGVTPHLSTDGGTSDGRFIAQMVPQPQIVELGTINASIHKIDECVSVADLQQLSNIYQQVMITLLG